MKWNVTDIQEQIQNQNCIYKEINLYPPRVDVGMKNVSIIEQKMGKL